MAAISESQLAEQLKDAGNRLLRAPPVTSEMLKLLDEVELLLSKLEQSPSNLLQEALLPAMKALISDKLLKNTDMDVKITVGSCLNEVMRITAPDPPYNDAKMKEIFEVMVASFSRLSHISDIFYIKAVSIINNFANVKSCLMMLDLECDELIIEMFEHFLENIRPNHPHSVFVAVETVMLLIIEESDKISPELLKVLLSGIKKENQSSSMSRKLSVNIIEKSTEKLKPYVMEAAKSMYINMDDYDPIVASLFYDAMQKNHAGNSGEQMVADVCEDAAAAYAELGELGAEDKPVLSHQNNIGTDCDAPIQMNHVKEFEDPEHTDKPNSPGILDETGNESKPVSTPQTNKASCDASAEGKCLELEYSKQTIELNSCDPKAGVEEENESDKLHHKRIRKPNCLYPDGEYDNSLVSKGRGERLASPRGLHGKTSMMLNTSGKKSPASRDVAPKKVLDAKEKKQYQRAPMPSGEGNKKQSKGKDASEESGQKKVGPAKYAGKDASEESGEKVEPAKYARKDASEESGKKAGHAKSSGKSSVAKDASDESRDKKAEPAKSAKKSSAVKDASEESGEKKVEPAKYVGKDASEESGKKVRRAKSAGKSSAGEYSSEESGEKKVEPTKSARKYVSEESREKKVEPTKSARKDISEESREKKVEPTKSARKDVSEESREKKVEPTKSARKDVSEESREKKVGPAKSTAKSAAEKDASEESGEKKAEPAKSAGKSSRKGEGQVDGSSKRHAQKKRKMTDEVFETPHGKKYYKEDIVGCRVKVWWPDDKAFYEGVVASFNPNKMTHQIDYDDGDVETLNLRKEVWEFIGDEDSPDDVGNTDNQDAYLSSRLSQRGAKPKAHADPSKNSSEERGKVHQSGSRSTGKRLQGAGDTSASPKEAEVTTETKKRRLVKGQKS